MSLSDGVMGRYREVVEALVERHRDRRREYTGGEVGCKCDDGIRRRSNPRHHRDQPLRWLGEDPNYGRERLGAATRGCINFYYYYFLINI